MAYNDHGANPATLLLTRPRAQSERFAADVRSNHPDLVVRIVPLMEIVSVGTAPRLDPAVAVIFTSANGVARAAPGDGRAAFCVGAQTTEAASIAGFDAVQAGQTADELVATLLASPPGQPLVHLRGYHQRGDIASRLSRAGLTADDLIVYKQKEIPPEREFFESLDIRPLVVPLFSPRSAKLFCEASRPHWGQSLPDGVRLVALSSAVANALPKTWRQTVAIAPTPDRTGMLDGIGRQVYP